MITQAEKMRRCVICPCAALRTLHFSIARSLAGWLERRCAKMNRWGAFIIFTRARSFSEKVNWKVRTMAQSQQIGNNEARRINFILLLFFFYIIVVSILRGETSVYRCLRMQRDELGVSLFGNVNISSSWRVSAICLCCMSGVARDRKTKAWHFSLLKIFRRIPRQDAN